VPQTPIASVSGLKPPHARCHRNWGKTIHQRNSIGRRHTDSNLKQLDGWCDVRLKQSGLILPNANALEGSPLPYQPSYLKETSCG
jgi:hypothetical protein